MCSDCERTWPCDAIREADRADEAEAALIEATTGPRSMEVVRLDGP